MLFQEQRESYGLTEGSVFLLNGVFDVDTDRVGELIGIRQNDGLVRAIVVYYSNRTANVRIDQVFSPADFEKFVYQLQQQLATTNKELLEFNYRTRTIDSPHTALLMDEEYALLTGFFLKALLMGHPRGDVYESINQKARQLAAQMS